MPAVTVRLPGLLSRFVDGERTVQIDADTVEGALDRLCETYPAIGPHLFERGRHLRSHLTVFHEGSKITPFEGDPVRLAAGDEVIVLQAVSGG